MQDQAKSVIESNRPLSCLAYFLDSLILEHLDQVLLNSVLKDTSVFNDRCILYRSFLACGNFPSWEELFNLPAIIKERLPLLLIADIEAHQHWEVRLLDVDPHVLIANNGVDLLHWTHRVV